MGQKVHPIGFRVGIYRDWFARWFARDSYGKQVLEDLKIRKYLDSALEKAEISSVEIEKSGDDIRIIVHSGKPGVIIGKKGQEIEQLRSQIGALLEGKRTIEISVQEVKKPELDAELVAKGIASQLERRASFKKVMKRAKDSAMKSGAKGVKICCSGRLNGAEIARTEWVRVGSVPLHTLRADIDYGFAEAKTTYGIIGVKVWICKGEYQLV
ncbi:MAG TPA: 30S ribosomal protein S3 [Candidatus Babeliales bacterium]|nr:30S ribosomal protein S3 [Candidatus Babeliales bacterium]